MSVSLAQAIDQNGKVVDRVLRPKATGKTILPGGTAVYNLGEIIRVVMTTASGRIRFSTSYAGTAIPTDAYMPVNVPELFKIDNNTVFATSGTANVSVME